MCPCEWIRYCSQECQQNHWEQHRKECTARLQKKLIKLRGRLGQDTDKVADGYLEIGDIYQTHGMFKDAEDSYFEALRIFEALHGDSDETVANMYRRLGSMFVELGLHAESDKVLKECLRIYSIVCGERSEQVGATLSCMAQSHFMKGRQLEALEQCLEALSIYEETLGRDHPRFVLYTPSIPVPGSRLFLERVLISTDIN
jgi:tetratricopeptide (TPR) repeat protein